MISIITVSYNSEQYIRSAIESVLQQTYQDIEYIVIDGGSTDDTLNILQDYSDKITHIVSEQDEGIYDAMNKGVQLASGDVIGVLNSDDFYPNSSIISNVVRTFNESPNIDMILGNIDFVDAGDLSKIVRLYSAKRFAPWHLKFGLMPPHPGAFIKKSTYEQVGNYKLGYKIGADFDMFVRMLVINKLSYRKLNKTLVRMRVGGVSTSGVKSYITSTKEMLRSLNENHVYSNLMMVLMRLPVKFFQKTLFWFDK